MKIKNAICAAGLGLILLAPGSCYAYTIPAQVTAEVLNVRQSPSASSPVIGCLTKGTIIQAGDAGSGNGSWNKVDFGGWSGYVNNAYLTTPNTSTGTIINKPTSNTTSPAPATSTNEIMIDEQQANNIAKSDYTFFTAADFRTQGVINWGGWRWTWYSTNAYPDTNNNLGIPGKYVDENGYVRDAYGHLCLASSDLNKGTSILTPFGGYGTVYDTGCPSGTLDVYTSW